MTSEFALRLIGMMVLALLGARLGVDIATPPLSVEVFVLIFGLVGALCGLILTPYFTTRPARIARQVIRQMPAEVLLTSIIGLIFGLIVGALSALPLSLLPQPFGQWVPSIVALISAYLMITIFGFRAKDVFRLSRELFRSGAEAARTEAVHPEAQ